MLEKKSALLSKRDDIDVYFKLVVPAIFMCDQIEWKNVFVGSKNIYNNTL